MIDDRESQNTKLKIYIYCKSWALSNTKGVCLCQTIFDIGTEYGLLSTTRTYLYVQSQEKLCTQSCIIQKIKQRKNRNKIEQYDQ